MTDLVTTTQPYELLVRWDDFGRLAGAHYAQAVATIRSFSAEEIAARTAEAQDVAEQTGEPLRPVPLGTVISFNVLPPKPVTDVSGDGGIMDELLGIVAGGALKLASEHGATAEALRGRLAEALADLSKLQSELTAANAELGRRDETITQLKQTLSGAEGELKRLLGVEEALRTAQAEATAERERAQLLQDNLNDALEKDRKRTRGAFRRLTAERDALSRPAPRSRRQKGG